MMVVKAATLAALILLAALTVPQITLTEADAGGVKGSAYALNQILDKAITNLQTVLKGGEGDQAYEALKIRLKEAETLAEKAQKAFNEGAYQDALNNSLKALSIVKSVAAEIKESEEEQIVAASHSTLRMSALLTNIKNMTNSAAAKGYNISNLAEKLAAVSQLVDEAKSLSAKGDALGAGRRVAEAKSMLGHLVSNLNQAYAKEKAKLAEEYVNKTLGRLFGAEGAKGGFKEQIEGLNASRRQIQAGKLGEAVKQINEVMKQMKKNLSEEVKSLGEEIQKIRRQLNDIKAKGVNVDREERMLQEASKLAEQATALLEKGDYIAARMKVAEAETILQRLR
jgi:septation ring formation regulator EzrA